MERIKAVGRLVAPALLVTLVSFAAPAGAHGQELDGTYAVSTPAGMATLSFTTDRLGTVQGSLRGFGGSDFEVEGALVRDDHGVSVQGTLSGGAPADFILYPEDDETYGFIVTPRREDGAPETASSAIYSATLISERAQRL